MTFAKFNRSLMAVHNGDIRADNSVNWMLVLMLMLVFLPVAGVWVAAFFAN